MGSTPTAGKLFMLWTIVLAWNLGPAAQAAAPACRDGRTPQLSGDLFIPLSCAATPQIAVPLPAERLSPRRADLKALAGAWEATAVQGLGRYELNASLKVSRGGRAEGTLYLRELQFNERLSHTLVLTPAKGPGRYSAEFSTDRLPGAVLKGAAAFGVLVSTEASEEQFEFSFANGASHRARLAPEGKNALRLKVWSSVPGTPSRSFETVLRRSARQR